MAKVKLQWHTERRKVNDLIPYSKNPRNISEQQIEALKNSLKKFNLVELPAIDTDNQIIAGHQRLKVLQLLNRGDEEIEVRVPNRKLTDEEFKQYLLTSNAVHGDFDFDALLKDFDTETLIDIGFNDDDVSNIWDSQLEVENDEDFPVEEELAKIKKPITKAGQIIQMGRHLLIAGDATDPAVLKKLFSFGRQKPEQATMLYLDPVYNLDIDYSRGIGGKQNYGGNVNDHRTESEYRQFLKKILENSLAVAKPNCHVFCYCDQTKIGLIQDLYRELRVKNKRVCLWIKNGFSPTPGVAFSKCFEPAVYGVKGQPALTKGIDNLCEIQNKEFSSGNRLIEEVLDQLDIWLIKRLAGTDYQHATSKPPNLHEKAIRRCTRPNDIILDSTAGSGSTMVACEQLKRRAYMCELELTYCDLIAKRYEALTKTKVKYLN
jgi:DNA modification methylase